MARLINQKTGEELKIGQEVTTSNGEKYILTGFQEPHKPSSTGKVYVKNVNNLDAFCSDQFFPSVIGAKIVDHQFS